MKAKFVMNLKISLLSIFFFQFQFGINGQGNIVPNNSDSIFPTMINELLSEGIETVSYTHLTLPTNREV